MYCEIMCTGKIAQHSQSLFQHIRTKLENYRITLVQRMDLTASTLTNKKIAEKRFQNSSLSEIVFRFPN